MNPLLSIQWVLKDLKISPDDLPCLEPDLTKLFARSVLYSSAAFGVKGPHFSSKQTKFIRMPIIIFIIVNCSIMRKFNNKQEDAYVEQALNNLSKTSRTAKGIVDTSANDGKATQMSGASEGHAVELTYRNFESVIRELYKKRHNDFKDPSQVAQLVNDINLQINRGITKTGVLLRRENSSQFPYTKVEDISLAQEQFANELAKRLSDPKVDSIETAAWIEWRINRDHVYADGCGKTQRALAALPLMRANLPLPIYDDPKIFFQYMPKTIPNPRAGPESYTNGEDFKGFLAYYRNTIP